MKRLKLSAIIYFVLMTGYSFAQADIPLELWYNKPATDWMTEALPIGNGYVGAMFFGGLQYEIPIGFRLKLKSIMLGAFSIKSP